MAPTTYLGDFAPYSVLDQDIIQRGHTAEYLSQVQDYLADAYLLDGICRAHVPERADQAEGQRATALAEEASQLFACGDYLHAERAMRNASLAAQGVRPDRAPRQLKAGEKVLLEVNPQPVFGIDGGSVQGCVSGNSTVPSKVVRPGAPTTASGALPATGGGLTLPILAVVVTLTAAGVRRRVQA